MEAEFNKIVTEVEAERIRQHKKWGEQNHPCIGPAALEHENSSENLIAQYYRIPNQADAKATCDRRFKNNFGSYGDILLEEVVEAMTEVDINKRRAELIQVAAVTVAWIEKIDRDLLKQKQPLTLFG